MVLRRSRTVVCLNERDRQLFTALYGRRRPENGRPPCLKDFSRIGPRAPVLQGNGRWVSSRRAVFSNFYGVKCPRKGSPFVDAGAAGRGPRLRERARDRPPHCPTCGSSAASDDLVPRRLPAADFIFAHLDGSGMKTKNGRGIYVRQDALRHEGGFEGADADPEKAGARCDDAESFIRTINEYPYPTQRFSTPTTANVRSGVLVRSHKRDDSDKYSTLDALHHDDPHTHILHSMKPRRHRGHADEPLPPHRPRADTVRLFLLTDPAPCAYEPEIGSPGGGSIHASAPDARQPFALLPADALFKAHPEYRIVHSHTSSKSAIPLWIARRTAYRCGSAIRTATAASRASTA